MKIARLSGLGCGALVAALVVNAAGCATPPRPRELDAYEALKRSSNTTEASKRSPDLVTSSDKLGAKAHDEWESNDLEESRRDAIMAQIKLKTALALTEQDKLKAKIEKLSGDQAASQEELASVSKDLSAETENLTLLQKYLDARKTADADKARLSLQMTADQQKADAEQQRLSQQLATEQKIAAAQLSLHTAETVDANKYASGEYRAATDMLDKAQAELKDAAFAAAQASADVAKKNADQAVELSKPQYEQAEETSQNHVRDEALAHDAAGIPGVTVRIERRGELQRLVLAASDLFTKKSTALATGHDDVMDSLAALIKKYPSYPVQVVGHTDTRGKSGELLALSAARSQSVFSALVARGVEARRLMTSGMGGDEPIADNHSTAGRAKNNRVEIVFLYH
ncbi:MAG TPA: OmpA family protein [Polyangia bacterium]|jgi:outer membrane protein OmpA-like peptidoglycan-associated protein|nr:OmpA family protein [Polyangia bacterium]